MLKKTMDQAVNQKDREDLQRAAGFDPKHMDPGRYRSMDHHLERTKGMSTDHADPSKPNSEEPALRASMRQDQDDRREMHRAMQTERQLNDPRHEVTDRAPAREMTDKEQARQMARENFARVMNNNSRERDQVDGRTYIAEKSRGGRSL